MICTNQTWLAPEFIPSVSTSLRNNITSTGTSLVVQWLRSQAPKAGGPGSIPGRGTRSHMPQLRVHVLQRRHNTAKITKTKTQHIACTFSYNFPRWAWSELLAPQGVLLHVWLLLLNVMFVKFIHIVGYICRSSIFSTIGRYSSNKCANIYLFYCWRAFG